MAIAAAQVLRPGIDLPALSLQGASSHSEEPCAEARGYPEAAMVKSRACFGARTSPEVANGKAWMSSGGAVRGPRRASSIARLPLLSRKWVEMAVVPTQVKVQAAAANTHDRNAQDVLARLATYNPMGGVARLPERSAGTVLSKN